MDITPISTSCCDEENDSKCQRTHGITLFWVKVGKGGK